MFWPGYLTNCYKLRRAFSRRIRLNLSGSPISPSPLAVALSGVPGLFVSLFPPFCPPRRFGRTIRWWPHGAPICPRHHPKRPTATTDYCIRVLAERQNWPRVKREGYDRFTIGSCPFEIDHRRLFRQWVVCQGVKPINLAKFVGFNRVKDESLS